RGFNVGEFAVIHTSSCGAENYEAGGVVVCDCVPNIASADTPPFIAMPGLRGNFERFVFEFFCGISGNGPEAPDLVARVGIVCDEGATDAVIGSVIANEDAAFGDVRSAGDSGLRRIANSRFPNFFSRRGVDGDETAIACTYKNSSIPDRDAAVRAS